MDRPSLRRPAALSTGAESGEDAGPVPAAAEGIGQGSKGRAGGGGRAAGAGVQGGQGDVIEPLVAMYSWAGQAEMVRAGQKDELYTSMLQDMLLESAQVPPIKHKRAHERTHLPHTPIQSTSNHTHGLDQDRDQHADTTDADNRWATGITTVGRGAASCLGCGVPQPDDSQGRPDPRRGVL